MKIVAAMVGLLAGLGGKVKNLFGGGVERVPQKFSLKKRDLKVYEKTPSRNWYGKMPAIIDTAFFGKSAYRLCLREKRRTIKPVTETSGSVKIGGKHYRVWSDGSHRLMRTGKRRLIAV